jgi:hypothetical protein
VASHRRLDAIVGVPGVDLLGQPEQACVLVGVGDLFRHKSLIPKLAFGVGRQVVVPLRVFGSAAVGSEQDRIGSIVKLGQLVLSRQTRLGTRGDERGGSDRAQDCGVATSGRPIPLSAKRYREGP